MAIVKSALFDKIEGSLEKVTFRMRRNKKIELGAKRIPFDPKSVAQLDSRAGYGRLDEVFKTKGWVTKAQYDRLSSLSDISSWNAFVLRHQHSMKYDPTAYWGIAEAAAGTIHDFMKGEHDSIAESFTMIQDGPALLSAMRLLGDPDTLQIADNSALDLSVGENLRISFQFRAEDIPSSGDVLGKVDTVAEYYRGYITKLYSNGTLNFALHDTTLPGGQTPLNITTPGEFNDGDWHTAEFLRDVESGKGYIFVDGNLEVEGDDNTTLTLANSEDLYIGSRNAASKWLYADIRDVMLKIWTP